MKRWCVELLSCPQCLPREVPLACTSYDTLGEEIQEGVFSCPACKMEYPIEKGIAVLVSSYTQTQSTQMKYESAEMVSSYLWSHYADTFNDPDATNAYSLWADLVDTTPGMCLDAGCAVGRFTFELSRKGAPVIGLDRSHSFIHAARSLMLNHRIETSLKIEGDIRETRIIELPLAWDTSNIEFIVADARAMPFASGRFSVVTSLNLLDKISKPYRHLEELNRMARTSEAQLLFSDP